MHTTVTHVMCYRQVDAADGQHSKQRGASWTHAAEHRGAAWKFTPKREHTSHNSVIPSCNASSRHCWTQRCRLGIRRDIDSLASCCERPADSSGACDGTPAGKAPQFGESAVLN